MDYREHFFYLKFRFLDRTMRPSLSRLQQAQVLSSVELAELNWWRRCDLVRLCAEKIPFYRDRFKAIGFEFGDLKTEEDFQRLPILEKEDIREHSNDLFNPDFDRESLTVATTGGTTGLPLKTYNDPHVHLSSMSWRMLGWWGVTPADNSAYLYRAVPTGMHKLKTDIALWPTQRAYIAAADMTLDRMECFYRKLLRIQPKYLVGYVGAIDEFSRFLESREYQIPSLKVVWTTSAPLPESKRSQYQRVFSCPVYTQYGSCEFYWIAAECKEQNGLHIGTDIRHVDVVDGTVPVGSGQFGDLLVTNLTNYAFPLLRYRVGDRGRLLKHNCSCGLPFPMMDYVKGRVSDSIRFRDGTTIPGEYWTTIFDDFTDSVKAFQVLQKSDYSLVISYEAIEGADATMAVNVVGSRIREKLRERIPLSFRQCDVSANDNGKLRFVVSELG